jgi:hypothetical protein
MIMIMQTRLLIELVKGRRRVEWGSVDHTMIVMMRLSSIEETTIVVYVLCVVH